MRFAVAGMAFAVALLMTPRALLDVAEQADSHEIPVDLLEPSDDCTWCSTVPDADDVDCDELDEIELEWLDPTQRDSNELYSQCRDDIATVEPSA